MIARDEFGRARLALKARTALPGVIVGDDTAVGQSLGDRVESLKLDAHLVSPSMPRKPLRRALTQHRPCGRGRYCRLVRSQSEPRPYRLCARPPTPFGR